MHRRGGHREGGVLGQQSDDRVDVSALEGVDEALHDAADTIVSELAHRGLLAPLGQAFVDSLVGALQGAVHGCDCRPERLRDLLGGETEHLAEDEHCPLSRRQVLERRHERQLHGLSLLVAGLGRRIALLEAQHLVGVGLQPRRVGDPSPPTPTSPPARSRSGGRASVFVRSRRGRRWSRSGTATSEARYGRSSPRQPSPCAKQGVLKRVLRVVERAQHPVAVGVERRTVGLDQAPESILVTIAGRSEQLPLRHARSRRDHSRKLRPMARAELIATRR